MVSRATERPRHDTDAAAIRRGQGPPAGQKVVLVLDQFEQWLHAHQGVEDRELVDALRHCDGGRLQCVVMVRDDFWMAATQFMQELEVRLVEAENSAAVHLFDPLHARKVLARFGRAYGRLPTGTAELSGEQAAFLEQAVAELAREGKVICVRLALFAEMVKGKPWTPATLEDVGGTEGVGVTFLEETFSAESAPPEHRLHQKAARKVLKEYCSRRRGRTSRVRCSPKRTCSQRPGMPSVRKISTRSSVSSTRNPALDTNGSRGNRRKTTPSNPQTIDPARKYYQLTHDYLVPSLREWLTRKQKETWRGRAELCLEERAAQWDRAHRRGSCRRRSNT